MPPINIMKVLNVGSTEGSCDHQALDTDRIQLQDTITSLRIQLNGLKAENVTLKRCYEELSKSNAYSRSTFTAKINALTAENAKLKTKLSGKKSSGSTAFEKPKVLALGMYTNSSKYVPPPKRANWVKPTPLPKNKQVYFSRTPQELQIDPHKTKIATKHEALMFLLNLSTRTKPALNHANLSPKCTSLGTDHILPRRSGVNASKQADHNMNLMLLIIIICDSFLKSSEYHETPQLNRSIESY
ncbi:hypothetical protein Tco_0216318 [Tanacetum coccineum]